MSVMKDTPTIISDRLVLRPIVATDAEDMWQDINDPEAIRLTGTHTSFTFEQIERYAASRVEQDDWWDLAVTKRDGGRYLGEVVLMDWDEDNRSCGFRIALSGHARDRGVGTEATRMLLDHAFANLPVHRVSLEVFSFNERAAAVYEKVGFRREGVLCDALWWDDQPYDAIVMSVLRSDWLTK